VAVAAAFHTAREELLRPQPNRRLDQPPSAHEPLRDPQPAAKIERRIGPNEATRMDMTSTDRVRALPGGIRSLQSS
jgi:hypothetical protein